MSITRHWILAIKLEALEELKDQFRDYAVINIIDEEQEKIKAELKKLEWNETVER